MCRIIHTTYTPCLHTTTLSKPCFALRPILSPRHVVLSSLSFRTQNINSTINSIATDSSVYVNPTSNSTSALRFTTTGNVVQTRTLEIFCPTCARMWEDHGVSLAEAKDKVKRWRNRPSIGNEMQEMSIMPIVLEDGSLGVRWDNRDEIQKEVGVLSQDEAESYGSSAGLGPGSGLEKEASYLTELLSMFGSEVESEGCKVLASETSGNLSE